MVTRTEEKELSKFVSDPNYREKVISRIYKERERQYKQQVKALESEHKKLVKLREKEIRKIQNSRWEKITDGFLVNSTEGKIQIDQIEIVFSDIKSAELNVQYGNRTETAEYGDAKKHASIGGAVAGGLMFGAVGAVAGGVGLSKTKINSHSSSRHIPVCTHIGVMVNMGGFTAEIVLLTKQVDQSSSTFRKTLSEAHAVIARLMDLSRTPVPEKFLKVEEEEAIREFDSKIASNKIELDDILAGSPDYRLPGIYRTEECRDMTDEEYLTYLKEKDNEAGTNSIKCRKNSRNRVLCWIVSVFLFLSCLTGMTENGGIISGIFFLIGAVMANPYIFDRINNKIPAISDKIRVLISVITFVIAVMTFPG